jgi:hypothetical protein
MNKDVIAYIELLKDIHTKTELVTERLFSMEYQMFAGSRSEIKNASDVDKLLALNHFLRMTVKEFYNTFMQRTEVTWLYDYVKKYKLEQDCSDDLYLINKWYNEFAVKKKFNPENKTNYAETVTDAQLLKDIEESLKIFQEIKELSKYIRNCNISYSPAGFFGVNKVEMVSKNLKATYPQLSVSTSLAYNLAKDNDMLELIEDEI